MCGSYQAISARAARWIIQSLPGSQHVCYRRSPPASHHVPGFSCIFWAIKEPFLLVHTTPYSNPVGPIGSNIMGCLYFSPRSYGVPDGLGHSRKLQVQVTGSASRTNLGRARGYETGRDRTGTWTIGSGWPGTFATSYAPAI